MFQPVNRFTVYPSVFCDEPGGQLHKASTTDIDTHVRECVTKLNDSGRLAKLAMSDMKQDKNCLLEVDQLKNSPTQGALVQYVHRAVFQAGIKPWYPSISFLLLLTGVEKNSG